MSDTERQGMTTWRIEASRFKNKWTLKDVPPDEESAKRRIAQWRLMYPEDQWRIIKITDTREVVGLTPN